MSASSDSPSSRRRAGSVYTTFLDADDPARVREAYSDQISRRLAEIKDRDEQRPPP